MQKDAESTHAFKKCRIRFANTLTIRNFASAKRKRCRHKKLLFHCPRLISTALILSLASSHPSASKPNTLWEQAHNPSGAGSQRAGSKPNERFEQAAIFPTTVPCRGGWSQGQSQLCQAQISPPTSKRPHHPWEREVWLTEGGDGRSCRWCER